MRRRGTEDWTKLPIWAQNRIRKLEADVQHYKAEAMEAAPGSFSRICIPDWSAVGMGGGKGVIEHGIPAGSTVRFYPGKGPRQPAVGARLQEPYIEVRLCDIGGVRVSAGTGQLVVYSESSNLIRVSTEPF